ncbi:MAG: hypothetical protein ACREPF_00455 [Rhodanobacteraceae bacterium]
MNKPTANPGDGLPSDAEIESRARAIFRSACEGTDSYHALRLGLARRRALAARARRPALGIWAPLVGATACCAIVAGVLWMHPVGLLAPGAGNSPPTASAAGARDDEDVTPEIGSSQMELVENLEFYRWFAAQPTMASVRPGDRR